ncbi:GA-like domain-containing protein [Enterococcus faecalis]|uniref:GA-like domain-containing protein n=1 Tax=Enterococcus faecalis TaxID=1351 RepID=UPI0022802B99|nr:hypothetical protein [Enterococcus faecalis]WAL86103.1 hypothetical protein OZE10_10530 [Enterococcus faecalis]
MEFVEKSKHQRFSLKKISGKIVSVMVGVTMLGFFVYDVGNETSSVVYAAEMSSIVNTSDINEVVKAYKEAGRDISLEKVQALKDYYNGVPNIISALELEVASYGEQWIEAFFNKEMINSTSMNDSFIDRVITVYSKQLLSSVTTKIENQKQELESLKSQYPNNQEISNALTMLNELASKNNVSYLLSNSNAINQFVDELNKYATNEALEEIKNSVENSSVDTSQAKEALSKAEAAIEAAKEAKANADKDKDGYISAEEKAAVDQAIQAAEAAKQAALEEIGKLPEGDIKAGLMGQANGLEIPESVTETNADAAKEALSKAEAAVEAAKEAKANADKDKDGYISAEEKAAVDQAIQAAEAAKQAALEEIGKLPEGDIKAGLMGQANGLEIPESVTETNADAAKEALSKAEAAVEAAKEAKANADKDKDGYISAEEKAAVDQAIQAAEAAKQAALEEIGKLPEGDIKAGLMGQANGLEIPESVTETNADAAKEALSKAEAAVEAAKEAKANADKDKDGYISAEEKAAVDQAIQAAEAAKQAALEEIGKLPEGDIKAGLMGQANGLEIPESVTETNADAAKEALSKAEAAVEAAKEAKANADKKKRLSSNRYMKLLPKMGENDNKIVVGLGSIAMLFFAIGVFIKKRLKNE